MSRKSDKRPMQSDGFAVDPFAQLPSLDLPPGPESPAAAAPANPYGGLTLHLRLEKKGRAGKSGTVLCGVPANEADALARDLRKRLGVGGSVVADTVELQGDCRGAVAEQLRALGCRVKGA